MMKRIIGWIASCLMLTAPAVPVTGVIDTRTDANARAVSGIVALGTPSGVTGESWNSAVYADGWRMVSSEGCSTNLLVLNGCCMRGGRRTANETWDASTTNVLRNSVFVPDGVTLTVESGAIMKCTPGTAIEVEPGGSLVLKGAMLADIADDSVGGDTNCDGADSAPTATAEDFVTGEGVPSITRVTFWNGGSQEGSARWYTAGQTYGPLPTLAKDGFRFDGWHTAAEGGSPVTAATDVPSVSSVLSVVSVYARWTAYTISLDTTAADVPAAGGLVSFSVSANTDWTVSTDGADWVTLDQTSGTGNGTVSLSVSANGTTSGRSATVRVTGAGVAHEFTVRQAGAEGVATPRIVPADGTEFTGGARRCAISCATAGATIHYTLNGKDPDATDPTYGGVSFNVFDTTIIKARAFKEGLVASAVAVARIVKKQTLADALDVPLWTVTNDADAPWTVDVGETHGTRASVRSGAINCEEDTVIATEVPGAGTLSFWWKVSCEDDPSAYDNWDYLACEVDGTEVMRIDGQTAWRQVSVKMGEGSHTVAWRFHKDEWDDFGMTGEDCGWVDAVSWTPSAVAVASGISESWLRSVGLLTGNGDKTAAEIAASDPDGDGMTVAQEYVAGTDPTDPASKLTVRIGMVDGVPQITWEPDLRSDEMPRTYTTWGSQDLKTWGRVGDSINAEYKFFRVSVEMP